MRRPFRSPCLPALLAILALPAFAQETPTKKRDEPNRGGEMDLSSADDLTVAMRRFKVQNGYEINLFASEKEFPQLAKPVALNFDGKGRMWVSTLPSYPHYLPGEPLRDKLLILQDADRDGRADTCKTFADDLYLPTGFEIGDGGVYVGLQPNVVFLKDTDGDEKADERTTLLRGFGTEDSHHAVHAFVWGPDGGLYFHEGVFFNTQVETPYGPVRLKDGGVFRFEPQTDRLNVFVSYPFANPWGHVFDQFGTNFIADASGGSNYFGSAISGDLDFPRKHTQMKVFTSVVRPTAGCELVASRQFPPEAQGNFLVNNTIGFQGIKQHQVIEEGSGYTSREIEPLLVSEDPNFRPVAIKFGPDGALYIVDWFNPLVGHMQYSLRDPRRDKAHGRIWRITAKDRPLVPPVQIDGTPALAKLELLKSPESQTRYRARIALRDHPSAEVIAALKPWVADLDHTLPDYERLLLVALWASQTIGETDLDLLRQLLRARDYHVRSGATRALRFEIPRVRDVLTLLKVQVADEAPRVRLEALLNLSFIRSPESARIALEALRFETDYYLDYVLKETITTLEPNWKPRLFSPEGFAADHPDGAAYLLARLETKDLLLLTTQRPSRDALDAALSRPGVSLDDRRAVLDRLAKLNGTAPLDELSRAVEQSNGDSLSDLAQLLAQWEAVELKRVMPLIEKLAADSEASGVRQAAYVALMRAEDSVDRVWQLASIDHARLNDLLDSTAVLKDAHLLAALYPKVRPLLTEPTDAEQTVRTAAGRHVRVELHNEGTLTLAEFEVFSAGENVARSGKATQSSTDFGGVPARAIDGRTDGKFSAGTQSHTKEREKDPWWEVDLGRTADIDRVVIWNRTEADYARRLNNFKVTILDADRRPVFARDANPMPVRNAVISVGPADPRAAVRHSALAAISRIPGHEADTFELLAGMIVDGVDVSTAIAGLNRLPPTSWPGVRIGPLAEAIVQYASTQPVGSRDTLEFKRTLELGAALASTAPNGAELTARLAALRVQTFTIRTIEAQMRYDVTRFFVEAGRPVQIRFENPDIMQHNLLVVQPGAKEEVGIAAEALAGEGFAVDFIPSNDKVLSASKLLAPKAREIMNFTAPRKSGDYDYLCTFPGHWLIMNGVMTVVPPGDARAGKTERADTAAAAK